MLEVLIACNLVTITSNLITVGARLIKISVRLVSIDDRLVGFGQRLLSVRTHLLLAEEFCRGADALTPPVARPVAEFDRVIVRRGAGHTGLQRSERRVSEIPAPIQLTSPSVARRYV